MTEDATLRVCYFGTYRAEYQRNRIMIAGLRRNRVEVTECHETLWYGIEDRVQATQGGWLGPGFLWRVLKTYARLIRRGLKLRGRYDVMVVGYPGAFDVFLARLLTWLHGRPLVWDILTSIYLIAVERGLEAGSRRTVDLIRRVERLACRLPERLILITEPYVEWFGETHGVPAARFDLVPIGADSTIFQPEPEAQGEDSSQVDTGAQPASFRVLYYGTYIPNHGVATIVEAARLLADEPQIVIEMIGDGPDRAQAEQAARDYGLSNVVFIDWLEPPVLRTRIAQCHLCLGVFGVKPQSLITVQNKIYEGMAMAKPVLTSDAPAVTRTLEHGREIYCCRRADPQDLADSIRVLYRDSALRRRIAAGGRAAFLAGYTVEKIGLRFKTHLARLLKGRQGMEGAHA